ncbi:MAG: hypothetical protein JNN15_20120 [Blastocatellia bacterium]|nr:hypothetical protein [Blastocatellia bacterium]
MTRITSQIFLLGILFASLFLVDTKSSASSIVSTVTFELDGMMGLFMGNPKRVSIGIVDAHNHKPEFTVYKVIENQTENSKETREIAHFTEKQLKKTLSVSVVANGQPNRVEKSVNKPLGKYLSLVGKEDDIKDFGWVVDIENDLYARKLKIKESLLFGKIHFNAGIFYANKLTEEKYSFVAADGSGRMLPFSQRLGRPAAKIDLESNQQLLISGFARNLRLKAEPGVNYLVTIHNLPPEDQANLNHFLMYYDIIDEEVTKYEPIVIKTSGTSGGSCPPRVFGLSSLSLN